MSYLIVFVFLFGSMLLYFKIANKYNIIDSPNERSSHTNVTVKGAGIVFWLSGVLYSVLHFPESSFFLLGLSTVCIVSFWDDVSFLSTKVRIVAHFLAMAMIFYGLHTYTMFPWWLIIIAQIFFVGVMNAYNFMDGINGLTGLYSLAVLVSLQYVNEKVISFTDPDFIIYAILACLVFLFFNFRKKAKCFAGDVGSLGIAFWIITLLLQLILATNNIIWILFLAIYGVDSVFTILHRISLKQNIFKPHRLHFYQVLVNEKKYPHLLISTIYAIFQLIICMIIIYFKDKISWVLLSLLILVPLTFIYLLKFKYIKVRNSITEMDD